MYHNPIYIMLLALQGAALALLMPANAGSAAPFTPSKPLTLLGTVGTVKLDILKLDASPKVSLKFQPGGDSTFDFALWNRRSEIDTFGPQTTFGAVSESIAYIADAWYASPLESMIFFHSGATTTETTDLLTLAIDPSHEVCGWSDGTECTIVPIPWLRWTANENTQFSIGISHQQYGEDTDLGVIGMLSMEF